MSLDRATERLWGAYVRANLSMIMARMELVTESHHLDGQISQALATATDRLHALLLLEAFPRSRSHGHFEVLVLLACSAHSDMNLASDLVERLDREWVITRIGAAIEHTLSHSGAEGYRLVGGLLERVAPELLAEHLHRCSHHPDPDIREVALSYRETGA